MQAPVASAVGAWFLAKAGFLTALAAVAGPLVPRLTAFDAVWYATIVDGGYQWPTTGDSPLSNLAFFPALPALASALTWLGPSTETALVAVGITGSIAAVVGIQRVGARVGGEAVGFWLAFLWAVAPRAHVQVMGYSEGPFTALIAWSLWALLAGRPVLGGTFALFAGLTRPAAIPLVALFALVWLTTSWRRRDQGVASALWSRELLAAALSASGFLAYWIYVAARTGDFFGYFRVQERWFTTLGTPFDTWVFVRDHVLPVPENWRLGLAILAVLLAYLGLLIWMVIARADWRLVVFVLLGITLIVLQQGYFHSKARFLLPLFPAWLPLAAAIPRWPAWARASLFLGAVALSAAWGVDTSLLKTSP